MIQIVCNKLCKEYSNRKVLSNVSFSLKDEILFIAGLNGAGKTTLIRIALGLDRPTSGTIEIKKDSLRVPSEEIGVVFDSPALYQNKTVKQNIDILCSGFLSDKKTCQHILDTLQISQEMLKKRVRNLSFGQQHRVSVAVALIPKPHVLFLDEPTIGLDPQTWNLTKKAIIENQRMTGGCVIVTGQDYFEMSTFSQKILILNRGRCVVFDSMQSFLNSFSERLLVRTSEDNLPDEINSLRITVDSSSDYFTHFFKEDDAAKISELIQKYKLQPISSELRKLTLKEAFLETINADKDNLK